MSLRLMLESAEERFREERRRKFGLFIAISMLIIGFGWGYSVGYNLASEEVFLDLIQYIRTR